MKRKTKKILVEIDQQLEEFRKDNCNHEPEDVLFVKVVRVSSKFRRRKANMCINNQECDDIWYNLPDLATDGMHERKVVECSGCGTKHHARIHFNIVVVQEKEVK